MSKNRPTPNPIINREIKIKKKKNTHFQRSRKEEIKKKKGHIQRIKNKNDLYLPKNETESQS